MNPFDEQTAYSASGNRERPASDDPEAQFYPPYTQTGQQSGPHQPPFPGGPQHHHHHHHGYGYGPDDPDGYVRPYGGWQGGPQPWQPWAWQGRPWGRRPRRLWKFALLLLLLILFVKPVLIFTFALAGMAFVILLVLLPLALAGLFFRHRHGWHGGWGRHWGGPGPWGRRW